MLTGRWTILAHATPLQRRPSVPYMRARVHVQCVCGLKRTVWLEDIEQQRSTGCCSSVCAARFRASVEMREKITVLLERDRQTLRALAHHLSESERAAFDRAIDAVHADRLTRLDLLISEWLRSPHDLEVASRGAAHA